MFEIGRRVSVSVPGANGNSGGRTSQEGVWRIIELNQIPIIQIVSTKADTGYLGIGWDERERTYLNQERAYVTEEEERC